MRMLARPNNAAYHAMIPDFGAIARRCVRSTPASKSAP